MCVEFGKCSTAVFSSRVSLSVQQHLLMHETVRAFGNQLDVWDVTMNEAWLDRKCRDFATWGVRQLKTQYPDLSFQDAMNAMRLCFEVALMRQCQGDRPIADEPWMLAWLKVVFKHNEMERSWMPEEKYAVWNLFGNLTVEFETALKNTATVNSMGIENCPSWNEVERQTVEEKENKNTQKTKNKKPQVSQTMALFGEFVSLMSVRTSLKETLTPAELQLLSNQPSRPTSQESTVEAPTQPEPPETTTAASTEPNGQ